MSCLLKYIHNAPKQKFPDEIYCKDSSTTEIKKYKTTELRRLNNNKKK